MCAGIGPNSATFWAMSSEVGPRLAKCEAMSTVLGIYEEFANLGHRAVAYFARSRPHFGQTPPGREGPAGHSVFWAARGGGTTSTPLCARVFNQRVFAGGAPIGHAAGKKRSAHTLSYVGGQTLWQ